MRLLPVFVHSFFFLARRTKRDEKLEAVKLFHLLPSGFNIWFQDLLFKTFEEVFNSSLAVKLFELQLLCVSNNIIFCTVFY